MKKILALFISILCVFGMSTPILATETNLNDIKTKLTIKNVKENEQFKVWKVINVNYNATTNEITYAWNGDFANFFTSQSYEKSYENSSDGVVEFIHDYSENTNDLNQILSLLPGYIRQNLQNKQPIGGIVSSGNSEQIVMDGENALNIGGYFIEPIETTQVYQPMFVSIVPTLENGAYALLPREFNAKHSDCNIDKKVSIDNINYESYTFASNENIDDKFDIINYQVTLNVPRYVNPIAMEITFSDTLPNGIYLINNSLSIEGKIGETYTSLNNIAVTITGKTISINLANYYSDIKNYEEVVIKYQAKLNENAVQNFVENANMNTASYTYTIYPYSGSLENNTITKTSSAQVYTYDLQIEKKDSSNDSKLLGGAEFALYRKAVDDTEASNASDKITYNNSTFVRIANSLVIKTSSETTDKGTYSIKGLVPGEYCLVETKAPDGYVLDNTPIEVNINSRAQNSTQKITIFNHKGLFNLPETGSTGKLIYSLAGLLLASIATICLIVVYKKGKKG